MAAFSTSDGIIAPHDPDAPPAGRDLEDRLSNSGEDHSTNAAGGGPGGPGQDGRTLKLAKIGEMAGSIAHEIKNPVFAMSGAVQVLEERIDASADSGSVVLDRDFAKSMLGVLAKETRRIGELANSLSFFAKEQKAAPSSVKLGDLVDSILIANSGIISEKGLSIELDNQAREVTLWADRDKLARALMNILNNAALFSPEGGTIRFRARELDGAVKVSVRDRGPGIEADDLERIFEPFFSRRKGGSGLGLAIARDIVELHGGEIGAQARAGWGTEIWLTLPARSG